MASDDGGGKPSKRGSTALAVGDAVLVQDAHDKSAFMEATIVRKHMSGEVTVTYTESQTTEKYVKPERVQLRTGGKNIKSKPKETEEEEEGERSDAKAKQSRKEEDPAFEEGDHVQYRPTDPDSGKKGKWRRGRVKAVRNDGSVDVVDTASDSVERKIPSADVKKASRAKEEDGGGAEWEEGDRVEFQVDGKWRRGRVAKRRKDGTYDVTHGSDGESVTTKVEAKRLRQRTPKKKATEEEDEDTEEAGPSIRKRKSQRKVPSQSDEEDEEEKGGGGKQAKRPRQPRRQPRLRFDQLRLHQLIEFQDDDGRPHRGYIKLLRREDKSCDIEHASDAETLSKHVPLERLTPVSMLGRLWGSSRTNTAMFALNTRVFYKTKHGERKGFVVKMYHAESPLTYDIEDEEDGDVVKKVPATKLRPVPWLSYPSVSLPSLPALPSLPSLPSLPAWTVLRKGMHVRVRIRDKESGKVTWEDGVILRMKGDATCVVACGDKRKLTVKNGDVKPKSTTRFHGLALPNLTLPTVGLHPPKSAVEVLAEGNNKVFLGTVVSVNEADKTYTILYDDGRKEKHVAAARVRLSLRRLRIGTEVEMIVEGPCKEVSKLDGEVAWVHRDEKVAVRIHGGQNDVFAEVCTHALMVDGQPAFAAPLSSSWVELLGFYLTLALDTLVFLWLSFGLCVELGEMTRLHDEVSTARLSDATHMTELYAKRQVDWNTCRHVPVNGTNYVAIPSLTLATDRAWLLALIIVRVVLTAACVGFSVRLVHHKMSAIQDNYIDVKEFQRDRVLRRHFARVMGVTIVVSFLTLIVYASLLNRFEWFCLFTPSSLKFDSLAMDVDVFAAHTEYATPVDLLLSLAAKSVFNLYRATALHLFVFAFPNAGFCTRLSCLPLWIGVTALVSAMGVAALHIFYYVQRVEMIENAILALTSDIDWALVAVMVAVWFNVAVVRLVLSTGAYFDSIHTRHASSRGDRTDDIVDQAERGEFGLQAKQEALYARVELKQEELGVCKLSVLRVQRDALLHLVAMILGICASATLRGIMGADDHVARAALTLHLVLCILWLVVAIITSLVAMLVKHESPELLPYILDV